MQSELAALPNELRCDPSSERVLLGIPDFAANHNGGSLLFGCDEREVLNTNLRISSFGEDSDGELSHTAFDKRIYRIVVP